MLGRDGHVEQSDLYRRIGCSSILVFLSFVFFVGCSAKILAGPHCKKDCTDTELSDGDIFYGGSSCVKFAEDGEGECFLLYYVDVLIFVASILLL